MAIAYTYEGAAEQTGLSVDKIKAAVKAGHLAAKYFGKNVIIQHTELEEFVAALPSERA